MKTKAELIAIIKQWWAHNQTVAQGAEGRYFLEQIGDWESGFRMYNREGWVSENTAFVAVKCKDIPNGLSIRLESGTEYCDGILSKGGVWIEKDTNPSPIQSARMDG